MAKVELLSEPLKKFVDKYFVNMDFSDLDDVEPDYAIENLSHVEKTLSAIAMKGYSDEDPSLWFNRELCLRGLVILSQLDPFAQMLIDTGYIQRALMLLDRVANSFNKKVLEDPELVKVIQEGRLDEVLEKQFPEGMIAKRTSNFVDLSELKELEAIPEDLKPVPEKF